MDLRLRQDADMQTHAEGEWKQSPREEYAVTGSVLSFLMPGSCVTL